MFRVLLLAGALAIGSVFAGSTFTYQNDGSGNAALQFNGGNGGSLNAVVTADGQVSIQGASALGGNVDANLGPNGGTAQIQGAQAPAGQGAAAPNTTAAGTV